MGVYVDLLPSPQFDRSLVTYCVVNFQRIQHAFKNAGKKVQFESWVTAGPWANTTSFFVPYLADVVIWSEITVFVNAVVYAGVIFTVDGVALPFVAQQTFNIPYSHVPIAVTNTVRRMTTGWHTYSQLYSQPSYLMSDGNDRHRMHFTYYAL